MLSRNITTKINWVLDNLVPPIIREWRPLMHLIIWFAYGNKTNLVLDFKDKYPNLTDADIDNYYEQISSSFVVSRPTDNNQKCIDFVLKNCSGEKILDVGCGRSYLIKHLSEHIDAEFTGIDVVVPEIDIPKCVCSYGRITNIPFPDDSFDTVICTHTLEHIRDYKLAINELVRVCKKGGTLITIIPKQREYKYTPDLHVNFCPYTYTFRTFMGLPDAEYSCIGGDFVCVYHKS